MKPVSIIQCSGMHNTGKTAFLEGLGTPYTHFGPPMLPDTVVGTYHALTQVMEEYTCWPAMADWNNRWAFWDRGLIEPYALDLERPNQTLRTSTWMAYYAQSVEILADTTQIFIVAIPDCTDEVGIAHRYHRAADQLQKAGAEVHIIDHYGPESEQIVRELVLAGRLSGFGHRVDEDGSIHFGNTGGR